MSGGLGHLTYQSEQIIINVLEYLLPILVNHLMLTQVAKNHLSFATAFFSYF
jgi:hypothetical protein